MHPQGSSLTVVEHPLVQHKLSLMRDRDTSTAEFRRLLPDFVLYKLGIACALIFHRFDHRHRQIGIRNLEIAFPEKNLDARRAILLDAYRNFGRMAAEWVHFFDLDLFVFVENLAAERDGDR